MKSPFPGMDPYLERHWRDVHASLVIYARDQIQPNLPEPLFARVEERVYLESEWQGKRSMYPDVRVVERIPEHRNGGVALAPSAMEVAEAIPVPEREQVEETFLEIVEAGGDNKVVTIVEFLSLTNKLPGDGQRKYRKKQQEVRQAAVNLVEIDLLRAGEWALLAPQEDVPPSKWSPYRAFVRRCKSDRLGDFFHLPLRQRLLKIPIPLRPTDQDILLDLQALIDQAYQNGGYFRTLDYSVPPETPLEGEDARWAEEVIRERAGAGLK